MPNYSFENYTTCPSASGQITFAFPWYGVTSGGSTDYYNTCGLISSYQTPRTGNGYTGIWVFSGIPDYREYLQVQLTDSLLPASCYMIEFYVNPADPIMYALSSVDAHFSTAAISSTGTGNVLNLSAQIKKFSPTAISDTVLWVKISGIYTASGGESYITIGNFSDDLNTDTINTGFSYYGSYYYIDDVSVIPIDSLIGGMPAFAGNDTSVTIGDSVFVGQEVSNLNCNWYDSAGTLIASNTSGIYVQPSSTTYFVVEQNLCGTITYDTVNVIVKPVGIEENTWNKKINIYPNPNTGSFSLVPFSADITELNVKVIDVNGKTVFAKTINSGDRMFNLSLDSPNGIYMLFVNNPQTNEHIVKRIVIQK